MDSMVMHERPVLRTPTIIAAFAGWPDAAESATGAMRYILRKLKTRRFAEILPEPFYNFSQLRPLTVIRENGQRAMVWPTNELFYCRGDDSPGDLILLLGTEPHLLWQTYVRSILDLAEETGIRQVVTLGGLYDNVLYKGEVTVTGLSNSEGLAARLADMGVKPTTYQGPTSIHSALREECNRRGIHCASLWGHAPSYVQVVPNFNVSYGIILKLSRFLKLEVDLTEIRANATNLEEQIERAISKDPELQSYVRKLEEGAGATGAEEMPSSDVIVRDLEDFLRRQREKQGDNG